jgi:transposase-like protein
MKQAKFTVKDFLKRFPTDDACLAELFELRFGHKPKCPKCNLRGMFSKRTSRRQYSCSCGFEIAPTAGTILHKSPTALRDWFFVMYSMTVTRNGISAKEVQRQLGVTYKTAWRMCHQVRKAMNANKKLTGTVEIDEVYIGGRKHGKRGRGAAGKTIVIGAVQRNGSAIAKVVPNLKHEQIKPFIFDNVKKGTKIYTDELQGYKFIPKSGYTHDSVQHALKEYVRGKVHTNSVEGFWSYLKRGIKGTHVWVSGKHL